MTFSLTLVSDSRSGINYKDSIYYNLLVEITVNSSLREGHKRRTGSGNLFSNFTVVFFYSM